MRKEMLHSLIDMIPETDADTIYRVLLKFIPSDFPLEDEKEAITAAQTSIKEEGTVSINEIDWD